MSAALSEQMAKVEAVEEHLAELEAKWAAGDTIRLAYERARPVLDKRLAIERDGLDWLGRDNGYVAHLDVVVAWEKLTAEEKRAVIRRFKVRILIGHRASTSSQRSKPPRFGPSF